MATIENPKIFISYSWTTPKHSDWVRVLAERLTQDGVQVILDQWDLKEGQDKYAFMERMVSDSDIQKVLLIIDRRYAEKANAREGGVGTESQIVSPKVYDSAVQEKFIPIVTEIDGEGKAYLPTYLKSRIYLDFVDPQRFEDEYERLLRIIYDRRSVKRPPLGAPPSHILEPDPVPIKVTHKLNRITDFFIQQNPAYKC
ncbi:MAG: hypothetical protein JWQ98_1042 [Chlorobi bacterium]|nr:hypothetical protein [Chlorobiota bacterium]